MLRPERILITEERQNNSKIKGEIVEREYFGSVVRYTVRCESELSLTVHQVNHGDSPLFSQYVVGSRVYLGWSKSAPHVLTKGAAYD